jgi:hypothetical protein
MLRPKKPRKLADLERDARGRFLPKTQDGMKTKKTVETKSPVRSPSVSPPSRSGSRSPSPDDYTPHTLEANFKLNEYSFQPGLIENRISTGTAPSTKTNSRRGNKSSASSGKGSRGGHMHGRHRKVMLKADSKTGGKFWEAWTDGSTVHVRFGSVKSLSDDGSEGGTTRSSKYKSADEAQVQLQKRIKEKLSRGYLRV